MTLESLGLNFRQAGLTERACRSPTRLTDANANSRAVFNESILRLEDCNGSNWGPFRALRMVDLTLWFMSILIVTTLT